MMYTIMLFPSLTMNTHVTQTHGALTNNLHVHHVRSGFQ